MDTNMSNRMNSPNMHMVMLPVMAVQRDRIAVLMHLVTKVDTNMNHWTKLVILVTMAIQRNRISMVMNSVTKMTTNVKHRSEVIMLVTLTMY